MGKRLKIIACGVLLVLMLFVSGSVMFEYSNPIVSSDGNLSLTSRVSIDVGGGDEKVEAVPPRFGKGGLPIKSIQYNTDTCILDVRFNGFKPLQITRGDIKVWDSIEVVEVQMNILVKAHLVDRGYGAVHVYSLEPLKFTTKFSKNKIEGEWWS